ncbi:MAG: DMT family transporter [Elusimicrobiota bacterium]
MSYISVNTIANLSLEAKTKERRLLSVLIPIRGVFEKIILTSACAFLLANSRFFNEQLSRTSSPLIATFLSHAIGLVFLISLAMLSSQHSKNKNRMAIESRLRKNPRRFGALVLLPAICSVAVVFFANATTVEVRTSAAIPLFLLFIVLFSLVIEAICRVLTRERVTLAGISLFVSLAFLAVQQNLLTSKGICLAAAAALSLIVSRSALRALSEATTPFTSCLLVHGVLGSIGFLVLGFRPDLLHQIPLWSCIGGVLGAGFQLLLVVTLRCYGDLLSNTLIQTEQILFGYVTSFY